MFVLGCLFGGTTTGLCATSLLHAATTPPPAAVAAIASSSAAHWTGRVILGEYKEGPHQPRPVYGTAVFELKPVCSSPYTPSGQRPLLMPLTAHAPINLAEVPEEFCTEELCMMALEAEEAVSVTSFCGILPGRQHWQINAVPKHVLTEKMALLSVSKGCPLDCLHEEVRAKPAVVKLAKNVEERILKLCPEGDVCA